jgi:hypothetical protein
MLHEGTGGAFLHGAVVEGAETFAWFIGGGI